MRSGCSLPATVLLLLFLGFSAWGARHWKPSIICDNSNLNWVCAGGSNVAGGLPGLGSGTRYAGGSESDHAKTKTKSKGAGRTKVAQALPWPIAEKPQKWSNFRDGAYSIPAVAAPIAVAVVAKTTSGALPWPIAEAPRKWSNFREGAFSISAVATPTAVSKTVAHGFPWPIADKSRPWSNFRKGAYSVPARGNAKSVTVAHGFPWPIAEAPRKWTNFRKAPQGKKIVAKKVSNKTVAHPFPWPIAKKPRKWTNFRAAPKRVTGVAHGFPWPIAKAPRKWTNFRAAPKQKPAGAGGSPDVPYADNYASHGPHAARNGLELLILRVKKSVMKKASACGAELNRVARDGVILFETASAKLRDSSYDTLDNLAGVAKTCDRVNIVVEGHTDDRGSAGFNQRLSEQRAQSVAAYLQGAGISASSLSAVGYGESRPAVPNTSRANMAKNRRIEFSVSGN